MIVHNDFFGPLIDASVLPPCDYLKREGGRGLTMPFSFHIILCRSWLCSWTDNFPLTVYCSTQTIQWVVAKCWMREVGGHIAKALLIPRGGLIKLQASLTGGLVFILKTFSYKHMKKKPNNFLLIQSRHYYYVFGCIFVQKQNKLGRMK